VFILIGLPMSALVLVEHPTIFLPTFGVCLTWAVKYPVWTLGYNR